MYNSHYLICYDFEVVVFISTSECVLHKNCGNYNVILKVPFSVFISIHIDFTKFDCLQFLFRFDILKETIKLKTKIHRMTHPV